MLRAVGIANDVQRQDDQLDLEGRKRQFYLDFPKKPVTIIELTDKYETDILMAHEDRNEINDTVWTPQLIE